MKLVLKNKKIIFYALTFLVGCVFFYLIPYTGDDWAWGSITGIQRLESWFERYNGRYAGNICVLLLTRSRVFRMIVMSAVTTSILYLADSLFQKTEGIKIIFLLMIVLMPITMFRQTFAWVAGFSNYVISTLLLLIYIKIIYGQFSEKIGKKRTIWQLLGCFLLAFITSLFVENLTIYLLTTSFALVIYFILRKQSWQKSLALSAGSLLGTICMFSNSAYGKIAAGDDYRSIGNETTVFSKIYSNIVQMMSTDLLLHNVALNICISICFVLISRKLLEKSITNNQKKLVVVLNIITIFSTIVGTMSFGLSALNYDINKLFMTGVTVLYAISIFIFSIIISKKTDRWMNILLILWSIVWVTAPLLVVSPINIRCFIFSYMMCILYLGELIRYLVVVQGCDIGLFVTGVKFLNVLVIICLFYIYGKIFVAEYNRIRVVNQQVMDKKKTVTIEHLPYEQFIWMGTPDYTGADGKKWKNHYKDFYGVDRKIKLKVK